MVKKSKDQQDDQQRDDQFIEIPEDRIEQMEDTGTEGKEEKPQSEETTRGNTEQVQGPKDAPSKMTEKSRAPRDDLLADVRQSLLEEEEEVEEPKGFFARIKNRLKRTPEPKPDEVEPLTQVDIEIEPQEDLREMVLEPKRKKKSSSKIKE